MYLDREAVESTLRKIAGTAIGSVVAFDYFNADLIEALGWYSLLSRYLSIVLYNIIGTLNLFSSWPNMHEAHG